MGKKHGVGLSFFQSDNNARGANSQLLGVLTMLLCGEKG